MSDAYGPGGPWRHSSIARVAPPRARAPHRAAGRRGRVLALAAFGALQDRRSVAPASPIRFN
jgi:hypothetical protein